MREKACFLPFLFSLKGFSVENLLFYPIFAMFFLFMFAYINLARTRVKLLKNKSISLEYFKSYIPKEDLPLELFTSARLLGNLFEAPILYFLINLLVLILKLSSFYFLFLSSLYVLVRYVHAYVLLQGREVKKRFFIFVLSQVILVIMWISTFIKII